jgi:bacteriocin biosynthesis cyclodehydratase domain-containing protein
MPDPPSRPCLALPFTVLSGRDQVRLVAGEEFRFTLSSAALESWLPAWLPRLDGTLSLDEALALLPAEQRQAGRAVLERLSGERLLVDGPVTAAHPGRPRRLTLEGTGSLREAMQALAESVSNAPSVTVLCQDRLDVDEALRFNERCLVSGSPWLWASCAALGHGYVGPVMLPDAGPCLACLFGHFRRLSPLPELYDELVAHARSGGVIAPTPMHLAGVAILARLAGWKASEWLARPEAPAALYRLHVLEAASLEVTTHAVLVDPKCPACRGRR